MKYEIIIQLDKLNKLKERLAFTETAPFYEMIRDRFQRHLMEFETVQSVEFSGKRVGAGRKIILELTDLSEITAIEDAAQKASEV